MTNQTVPKTCPRCDSSNPETLSHSPVKGAWVVYHCPVCFFAWRNTEPEFITDPAKYDPHFKFKPADMEHFDIMPSVPELETHRS